jgi:dTDP-4-dehydrorhamnose reductase
MLTLRQERVILLTGVGGQVGFELARSLQGLGRVVAVGRGEMDLADFDQVRRVLCDVKPHLIVNPAAHTAVDQAETDIERATRLNAEAPGLLAQEARRLGAKLVHYSTDYVFDGSLARAYVETDRVGPLNVYGRSKLAGEQAITAAGGGHLIFRTSWVYGLRGRNFLLTMLRLAAERDALQVVSDQVGAPTWSATIAALTAEVLAQAVAADDWNRWWDDHSGVYHLTAGGETSWCGFAEAIFAMSGLARRPRVEPIPGSAYPTPAVRPCNSRLSNDKLTRTFGLRAPHWREALGLCLAQR